MGGSHTSTTDYWPYSLVYPRAKISNTLAITSMVSLTDEKTYEKTILDDSFCQ